MWIDTSTHGLVRGVIHDVVSDTLSWSFPARWLEYSTSLWIDEAPDGACSIVFDTEDTDVLPAID